VTAAGTARRALVAGWAAVAVCAAVVLVHAVWIARHPERVRPVAPGDLAPDFTLPDVDARGAVSLAGLRGQVVLIDFWATWCGPCRASMPAIERVYATHRGRGLAVVSVNTEGVQGADRIRSFVQELGLGFPVVIDDGSVADAYRVTTIPHLVLVDRRGVIRKVHRGTAPGFEDDLRTQVEALLAEPG
jgi:thiol-disulfide isomerase/thioredoxin